MFEIRVNGETVWKTDLDVDGVSLQSARGEAGRIGISTEGVVDVIVTEIARGGNRRLEHVEALERLKRNEIASEDQLRGNLAADRYVLPRDTARQQGEHVYTAASAEEEERIMENQEIYTGPIPDRDLAAGLDGTNEDNTDELNRRIEGFSESGSAEEVMKDVDADATQKRQAEAHKAQKENSFLASGDSGKPVERTETDLASDNELVTAELQGGLGNQDNNDDDTNEDGDLDL